MFIEVENVKNPIPIACFKRASTCTSDYGYDSLSPFVTSVVLSDDTPNPSTDVTVMSCTEPSYVSATALQVREVRATHLDALVPAAVRGGAA